MVVTDQCPDYDSCYSSRFESLELSFDSKLFLFIKVLKCKLIITSVSLEFS